MVTLAQSAANWRNTHTHVDHVGREEEVDREESGNSEEEVAREKRGGGNEEEVDREEREGEEGGREEKRKVKKKAGEKGNGGEGRLYSSLFFQHNQSLLSPSASYREEL